MSTKGKKGRNPPAVDNWLDSILLYRKNVAYDETCLFRAVSEQLFECQIYHERVRKDCVDYGRRYHYKFWSLYETEQDWYEHLNLLEKHMAVCGNTEIQIVSQKYDCDIVVYDAARQKADHVTNRNKKKSLMLCLLNDDHYDVVHKREHIQNSGFCQSIVYNILYSNVFQVPNVEDIVHGMLYGKEFNVTSYVEENNNKAGLSLEDVNGLEVGACSGPAPFPFKVAKALDPTIYRNIEYDAWTEVRREMRLGEWYYGDDNLILGTRCVLNDHDDTFECYIQEIIKHANKCVVYVTKLAEKRTVNYTDLSPENDAKPWPLPYRFSKNLVVTASQSTPSEKMLKPPKKRKDKRRTKSSSDTIVANPLETFEQGIGAFVGVPLQMQNNCEQVCAQQHNSPEPTDVSLSQHNLLVTPDIPSPMPKFSWETPWNNVAPPEKIIWSHPPGAPHHLTNYNMKHMIASAPVTPDVVPYHDAQYPFVYNYYVENYNNTWSPANEFNNEAQTVQYTPEVECANNNGDCRPIESTGQSSVHHYDGKGSKELPPLCNPLSPNPPVEMYSPVIPIAPAPPVIYAHPPEMTEMLMPGTSVQMYTPPMDVQYVAPGPYIYPPTPPTAWYTPGINSQGFIFPAPFNQNN